MSNKYRVSLYQTYQLAWSSLEDDQVKRGELNEMISTFLQNEDILKDSLVDIQDLSDTINKGHFENFVSQVEDYLLRIQPEQGESRRLGREHIGCLRLVQIAEILNIHGQKYAALHVAIMAARKAKKYYLLHLSFQAHRIIYSIARFMQDSKLELDSLTKFLQYLDYYTIEKKIEIEHNEISQYFMQHNDFNAEYSMRCKSVLEHYAPHAGKIPSYFFHISFYYLGYIYHTTSKNQVELDKLTTEALDYFFNLNFVYRPGILAFLMIKLTILIQNRNFDECDELISRAAPYVPDYTTQWARVREMEFFLNLHRGNFEKAVEVYYLVANNKVMLSLTPYEKQRWDLYEAYTNLLIESGAADYSGKRKRFSIQRFINDLPVFSKDKRSMNIPILIAQMLFFIVRHKYNHAIDRIEALEKYSSRYLRNDETFRSNCFIKMILEIPKNNFNRLRIERAAEKHFKRLLDSEIDLIDQPFEVEIIPYERLWGIIMNHLKPDYHYTPKPKRNLDTQSSRL